MNEKGITDLDTYFTNCLYFASNVLNRAMNEIAEEAFASTTLNPSYAFLMMAVCEKGSVNVGEVAKILHLAPSTITRFVDKLIAKKYLKKEQNGRVVTIKPTKKGKDLLPEIEASWHKMFLGYCDVLGEEFAVKLTKDIAKANEIIKKARKENE